MDAATNHMIGQSYDANGNMLSSPAGQTLSYDVENRLASALATSSGMKYAYDGQNKRVWSCTWDPNASQCTAQTVYFYGPDGRLLSQITPSYLPAHAGNNGGGRVPPSLQLVAYMARQYFGGRMLGNEDRLGSRGRYYPYGEDRPISGQQNPGDGAVTFATYTRDSATGLNYADQRYYATGWGRFVSPDPSYESTDFTAPQTWNRYSYVINEPVNSVDPSGLCGVIIGGITQTPSTQGSSQAEQFATQFGAISAYPYAGGTRVSGASNTIAQSGGFRTGAVMNAYNAIELALQSQGPINIIAFSGGAAAFINAWNMLSSTEQARIQSITYIDPGSFGQGLVAGLPGTETVLYSDNSSLTNSFVNSTSNTGLVLDNWVDTISCGHKLDCVFELFWGQLQKMIGGPCDIGAGSTFGAGGIPMPNPLTGTPFSGVFSVFYQITPVPPTIAPQPHVTSTIYYP